MTTYYMTCNANNQIGYWERCKSTTLIGAKRESTREYGDGYIDAELIIAEGDAVTVPRIEIAKKSNASLAKWQSLD